MEAHTHLQNPHTTDSKRSKLEQRVTFFFVSMGIAAITYGLFYIVDFVPEEPSEDSNPTEVSEQIGQAEDVVTAKLPTRIILDSLDREIEVLNPTDSNVASLDAALLKGVIRHPDSADFERTGTIFILGHSSYLPNVKNKNFQAFNGIQKMKWGDTIRVQSADREYVYSVDRVYEAKASTAEVPLQFETAKLVLATCDSFGSKDDRFIVEASLVESKPLKTAEISS